MEFADLWRRLTGRGARTGPDEAADPWRSPEGARLLGHLHRANPDLAAEVERGRERRGEPAPAPEPGPAAAPEPGGPLHAHEVTPDDAAWMRRMAHAHFADDAVVTLPSGRTVSGAEVRRWVQEQG